MNPASEKQISFINDLLATRDVTPDLKASLETAISSGSLSKLDASKHIDALIQLPKLKLTQSKTSPLHDLPKAKYAVPADDLAFSDATALLNGNDHLFVEVREYLGTVYMRKLSGSLGGFVKTKLTASQQRDIIAVLKSRPYAYTRIFGEIHACCGKCGAELTDKRSRELFLGPTCRKEFATYL